MIFGTYIVYESGDDHSGCVAQCIEIVTKVPRQLKSCEMTVSGGIKGLDYRVLKML
jgi:hypothetical protein